MAGRQSEATATSSSVPRRPRKPRGRGLRVRTGCTTCRIRHLKCDEARPVCRRCEKVGQDCTYTENAQVDESRERPSTTATSQAPSRNSVSAGNDGNGGPSEHSSSHADRLSPDPLRAQPEQVSQPGPPSRHSNNDAAGIDIDSPLDNAEPHLLNAGTDGPLPTQSGNEVGANLQLDGETWMTSPGSTFSNQVLPTDVATSRWFQLLTDGPSTPDSLWNTESATFPPETDSAAPGQTAATSTIGPQDHDWLDGWGNRRETLSPPQVTVFQHFVTRLSSWIDLTDPEESFSVHVSALALHNQGLLKAILALATRHLCLLSDSREPESGTDRRTLAVQYYDETLRYLRRAMRHQAYLTSEELLATVLIISLYEMIDNNNGGWERHLKGVFWIQNSQLIHGEYGGLKQAIWWAWLRQDIWAAFRERREVFSYYQLQRPCSSLDRWGLVNRAVFLLAKAVNFASDRQTRAGQTDVQQRLAYCEHLMQRLDEWWSFFCRHYHELPTMTPAEDAFHHTWVHPVSSGCAMQMYYVARLLIVAHRPAVRGFTEMQATQKRIQELVDRISSLACTATTDAAVLVSTQCVYAAGTCAIDDHKRLRILELIRSHRSQIGWPATDLGLELQAMWDAPG